MRTTTNRLLCDTEITPDGCVLTVEDAGADRNAGSYVHRDITPEPDGAMTIPSGVIAVGDVRNPDRHLLFGSPAVIRVRVFVADTVDLIHFRCPPADYPVSGPSDITVLLPDDPAFSYAVANTSRPPWWSARRYLS